MRHRLRQVKLNRTRSHRDAMFANMAVSLIIHEQIKTTVAKAKALRPQVERLVTAAKKGRLHDRRRATAFLQDDACVRKLMDVLAERYRQRAGGYLRIMRAGHRYGDYAPMAYIEFVDRDGEAKGAADLARVQESGKESSGGEERASSETENKSTPQKKKSGLFNFMRGSDDDKKPSAT